VEIGIARKRLEAMRDDLDRSIVVLQSEHPRARGGEMEAGDAGANLTEADRNEASVASARAQRVEVMAALSRVEDGSYGKCVDCGQPVPDGRLDARPTTTRCVACQNKRDRRRR
jgi:RNA polymerase-binding transcription factor DksA